MPEKHKWSAPDLSPEEKEWRFQTARRWFEAEGFEAVPREDAHQPDPLTGDRGAYAIIVTGPDGTDFTFYAASYRWRPCGSEKLYRSGGPRDFIRRFLRD